MILVLGAKMFIVYFCTSYERLFNYVDRNETIRRPITLVFVPLHFLNGSFRIVRHGPLSLSISVVIALIDSTRQDCISVSAGGASRQLLAVRDALFLIVTNDIGRMV